MTRAAVVGAAGFIGSRLCNHLADRGADVIAIDRHPLEAAVAAGRRLQGEFPQPDVCEAIAAHSPDHVYLLAGTSSVPMSLKDPLADLSGNARDTLAFLDWMRTGRLTAAVVYVSSAAVYGDPSMLPATIASPVQPISPYGISKLAGELYVRLYSRMYGLDGRVVRPFSVYGPGLRKQVVWDIMVKLHGSQPARLDGSGRESRDFIYVDDVCTALATVAESGHAGAVYNVCSGKETSIAELADMIATMIGRPPVRFSGEGRPGDPRRWIGACPELVQLGWHGEIALPEGLRRTVDWFRSNEPARSEEDRAI